MDKKNGKEVHNLCSGFGGAVLPSFQGRSTSFHLFPPARQWASVWTGCVVYRQLKSGISVSLLERMQGSNGNEKREK